MPTPTAILHAVNTATPSELVIGDASVTTGIVKRPRPEGAYVAAEGIAGDFIGNTRVHGGADQAIYLYSAEDAAYWSRALGIDCLPGFFGENLTIDRWWPEVRVGDRLTSGTLVLELTFPRIPCATLAARTGDARFVKRFAQAERPGAYARVVSPGHAHPGDTLHVAPAPGGFPLVTTLFHAWHDRANHREVFRDALRAPLASRWRAALEYVLAHPEA